MRYNFLSNTRNRQYRNELLEIKRKGLGAVIYVNKLLDKCFKLLDEYENIKNELFRLNQENMVLNDLLGEKKKGCISVPKVLRTDTLTKLIELIQEQIGQHEHNEKLNDLYDIAFIKQCNEEMVKISYLMNNENQILSQDIGFYEDYVSYIYQIIREINCDHLSEENEYELRMILLNIDNLRRAIRKYLFNQYQLLEIKVIPGYTKFRSDQHMDSESHQIIIKQESEHNLIYELLAPGFKLNDKLVVKAYVKRFIYKSPTMTDKESYQCELNDTPNSNGNIPIEPKDYLAKTTTVDNAQNPLYNPLEGKEITTNEVEIEIDPCNTYDED